MRFDLQRLPSPLNPLHQFILVAEMASRLWKRCNEDRFADIYLGDNFLTPLPVTATAESFPLYDGKPVYPDVEQAGIAGLYEWLTNSSEYKVIFSNGLAYEMRGIDALAYNRENLSYLICEAKGSTGRERSAAHYLKETKNRGRQLSWQWCWNCIVDFAEFPCTAKVFLKLYKPMILRQNIKRLLSVAYCEKVPDGYIIKKVKIWHGADLNRYEWFRKEKDWSQKQQWLKEIEASQHSWNNLGW